MSEEQTVSIAEFELRSIGEMVAEILRNEGIEAHLMGTSFLNSAYLMESKLFQDSKFSWRLTVPVSQVERAKQILAEFESSDEE